MPSRLTLTRSTGVAFTEVLDTNLTTLVLAADAVRLKTNAANPVLVGVITESAGAHAFTVQSLANGFPQEIAKATNAAAIVGPAKAPRRKADPAVSSLSARAHAPSRSAPSNLVVVAATQTVPSPVNPLANAHSPIAPTATPRPSGRLTVRVARPRSGRFS